MRSRLPLAYQILALQVCIVVLTAGVGLALGLWQARQQLDVQYQQRSLAVAESVASMPAIKSALADGDPAGSIESTAEEVRRSTGASYVVVADRNGIRFSHPNRALIGKPVDESPGVVLAGHTWVGVQRGTLGDAARGKAVFQGKGGCQMCHKAEGAGGTSGPDLSAVGAPRGGRGLVQAADPAAIERSILDPNADIVLAFRVFQVTPTSGAAVRGRLMNQDTFSVQLLDGSENLRSFLKSNLKEFGFLPSPMPSYRGRLTPQEVADVVSYLLTLKG